MLTHRILRSTMLDEYGVWGAVKRLKSLEKVPSPDLPSLWPMKRWYPKVAWSEYLGKFFTLMKLWRSGNQSRYMLKKLCILCHVWWFNGERLWDTELKCPLSVRWLCSVSLWIENCDWRRALGDSPSRPFLQHLAHQESEGKVLTLAVTSLHVCLIN